MTLERKKRELSLKNVGLEGREGPAPVTGAGKEKLNFLVKDGRTRKTGSLLRGKKTV